MQVLRKALCSYLTNEGQNDAALMVRHDERYYCIMQKYESCGSRLPYYLHVTEGGKEEDCLLPFSSYREWQTFYRVYSSVKLASCLDKWSRLWCG